MSYTKGDTIYGEFFIKEIKMKADVKSVVAGTGLSILIFFSISFLMVLYRISPMTYGDSYSLNIGFPFIYYKQFQLNGSGFLNSSWNLNNLIMDCILIWTTVTGLYVATKRRKAGNQV